MIRGFEKISFEQFKKDISDDIELYNNMLLPRRGTGRSAGYDLKLINDVAIKAGEVVKVPTGIKSYFQDDEVLYLIVRSSTGFKHNIRLCNQVGVIDVDYYNNEKNEGHIWLAVQNHSDKDLVISKNDSLAQGIFAKYLVTDDDNTTARRMGGIGSTNGGDLNEKL